MKINPFNLFGLNDEELVETLEAEYKDEVRPVNEDFINAQLLKYSSGRANIHTLPAKTVSIFLPLEDKSTDNKIKYILWKEHSVCEVLMKAGYKKCYTCDGCNHCKVQYNCASALRRAITEEALK